MTQVDPFIHPIPRNLQQDNQTRSYFEYLHRFLHDMWKRSGGGSDLVADTGTREAYPWAQDDAGEDVRQESVTNYSYTEIPVIKLNKKTIDSEIYTATDNMFIYMKNGSTLTLPQNPIKDSVIWFFKLDNKPATIKGNGKKVNGTTDDIIFRKPGVGRQIHYFDEIGEWVFI